MRLRKCSQHGYTLQNECSACNQQTQEVHYKFLNLKNNSDKQHK